MFRNSYCQPARIGSRPVFFSLLVAVMLLTSAVTTQAQNHASSDWNNTSDPLVGAIGLHYGQLGGHGLAFRAPVHWWLYVQVAGGVWHTGDTKQHNIGLNLNYILRQDQKLRIFINGGAGYFYDKEIAAAGSEDETYSLDTNWNLGGGVGIEYLQGHRWAWKVEANFAHLGKSGDIKVVPQAGISFYW